MDVSAASLRSFLVLAKELHFGRAAKVLRISTPSLSKQIVRLETQLGDVLFDRSPRQITLTRAGREFLPVAEETAKAFDELRNWAERPRGDRERTLTIGMIGAGLGPYTSPILAAANEKLTGVRIEIQRIELAQIVEHTRYDQFDILFGSRLTGPWTDTAEVLASFPDPRTLMVSRNHRFAHRESVTLDETTDETYIRVGGEDFDDFLRAWMIDPRPDGRALHWGPRVDHLDDLMDLCAAGFGVNLSVASSRFRYQREDIVWVPVTGAPPGRLEISVQPGRRDAVVDALVDIALDIVPRRRDVPLPRERKRAT